MSEQSLENTLARLLGRGTFMCSCILGIGILLDIFAISLTSFDLVEIGIVGFILLPILRLVTMLVSYAASRDVPMIRVVATVLTLVVIGACVGILW